MSRNIRSFSTLRRTLFKDPVSLSRQHGAVHLQQVRIVKPFFTARRAQSAAVWLTILGWSYYRLGKLSDEDEEGQTKAEDIKEAIQHVKVAAAAEKLGGKGMETEEVASDELKAVEETDDEDDDDDLVPEEQPDDAWFIPLGWAQEVSLPFYSGDDPEWQSFVDFSKDVNRGRFVKNELAGLVGHHISSMKNFQRFLGAPVTTGKYWLDFDFPDGPPPEYERYGLEITEDYVALTVRPVSALNVARLQGALWPTATGSSLWASCSTMWQLQMAKVRKALDLQVPEDRSKKQQYPAGYADMAQLVESPKPDPRKTDKPTPGEAQAKPPDASPSPASVPENTNGDRPWILRPLPAVPKPNTDLSQATTIFKHYLAKNWKQASIPPPRGTFLVSGLVEVHGPRAICTLDVRAAYDPSQSAWVAVGIGIRRVQRRKQAPRG